MASAPVAAAMFVAKELEPTAQWKKTNTAAAIRKRLRAEEIEVPSHACYPLYFAMQHGQ